MDVSAPSAGGSILGHPVRRTEDVRLITGAGRYADDVPPRPDTLHAVFVRSVVAHARLLSIDTSAAEAQPGAAGVYTAATLGLPARKGFDAISDAFERPELASDRVRFVGEPIAVVLATSRAAAQDAAELVEVEYDPLPAVVDPEAAGGDGAALLFEDAGTNVCHEMAPRGEGDALDGADVTVRLRFRSQRLAPVPLEPNAMVAEPDESTDGLVVRASCQGTFAVRGVLCASLGLPPERVRVIAADVGGGFGPKFAVYPEQVVVAALARRLGRQVRWVETRSENLLNMYHGRAQTQELEVGARRDGTLVGLRVRILQDAGAYPMISAWLPNLTAMMMSGVYRLPRFQASGTSVVTNTTPVSAYRGAGRPEAASLIERAMDLVAAEVGLDPAEVRRRNFIEPSAFPVTTISGARYDSGDYAAALQKALEVIGYEDRRREQAERRARGDRTLLGIGMSTYVEVTGAVLVEYGSVRLAPDGRITVLAGTTPSGQGHETTFAQLAAERFQVPMSRVAVVHSDTGAVSRGFGTVGSRSMQIGGSAVNDACLAVIEEARTLAGELLEVDGADLEVAEGGLRVVGVPTSSVTWAALAERAGAEGLRAEIDFTQAGSTFPFGAHVAVVEVDLDTGDVRHLRHVAVDDCGRVLNPLLVQGQQHGGVAQGAAQALYEEIVHDADGTPRTASLIDYAVPTANELPAVEATGTVTPTPLNPLGVKGIGESGTIGAGPAVHNAVLDALAPLGIAHLDMPLTPEKVWRAVRAAGA
jgi:aerobic carbon-monoxide dehydrogenase large subunit